MSQDEQEDRAWAAVMIGGGGVIAAGFCAFAVWQQDTLGLSPFTACGVIAGVFALNLIGGVVTLCRGGQR